MIKGILTITEFFSAVIWGNKMEFYLKIVCHLLVRFFRVDTCLNLVGEWGDREIEKSQTIQCESAHIKSENPARPWLCQTAFVPIQSENFTIFLKLP